jgi:hypothetical protein
MRQQSYLVRKGARYHFRRRIASDYKCGQPITVPLNTAEPDEARRLARRLAVKWDEMVMEWQAVGRGTLTLEEQRLLFRKGLEDELAHATRHMTAPRGNIEPHPSTGKVLAAAYEIVRRVPPEAPGLRQEQVDFALDETWSPQERELLIKTLKLYVTPAIVTRQAAADALTAIGAPANQATIDEARSTILRGRIEAQRRSALIDHPLLVATGDPAYYLTDDALVAEARRSQLKQPSPASAPAGLSASDNGPFARTATIRFSEQIDELEKALFELNGWQRDHGKTRLALESFAWITGDKLMSDYRPSDIIEYVQRLAKIPRDFGWGELGKSGGMAQPFDLQRFKNIPPPEKRRSDRTINSYLTKLAAASEILKKSYWLPAIGFGNVMDFNDCRRKIEDDPTDPKRVPWTPNHLRTMYSLPLWQGGGGANRRVKASAAPRIYQDAAYWVPLLGTYTGLAREEACGLEVIDFSFECEIPFLIVQANMTRTKDGKTKSGLKRLSRRRVMPLHPELLRLGLREYVKAVAAEGYEMVFPELYVPEAKKGKADAKAPARGGRRFYSISWCFIMDATHAIMPLPATSDGKKADFHSQRTYNNSVLASPEISETLIADHMGHARRGTGARSYNRRALTIGQEEHLRERLGLMVKLMPVVSAHVPRAESVNLLHISNRSRVGSAPGRNAKARFCS